MVRHILFEVRRALFGKVIIEALVVKLRFGDGNAATTGIETGVIWGLFGGLTSVLNNNFVVEEPIDVQILPEFNQKMLDLYINGIIRTRLVHIIIAAFVALRTYNKYEN